MIRQHSPDGKLHGFQQAILTNPHGPEGIAYRIWMRDVLQPLNEKAAVTIFDHIDLLDVEHVVPELLQMVAHVATMRVMLKRWEEGEVNTHSVISYPNTLLDFVQKEFARVKRRQAALLGFNTRLRAKL